MPKYIINFAAFMLWFGTLASQSKDTDRTNDLRMRWNMGQFANIGRYAFQFGIEKDFAPNKTFSAELGLSFYRGTNNINFERYNYKGIQGLVEYRNYFKGFHPFSNRQYLVLGLAGRQMSFDAEVTLGYNIKSTRDWNNATHFETATTRYNTLTGRFHAGLGFRLPLSENMYMDVNGGPAFGFYKISNDLTRPVPFVTDNFSNPFFMSSQTGSYLSPALYGSVCFGFVISKSKKNE